MIVQNTKTDKSKERIEFHQETKRELFQHCYILFQNWTKF
jgi:hypothetical protein